MPSAARSEQAPARGLLSIGQVLAKVSVDFPDITPSKLRFLEEQGLLHPARTPSGYRKFSPADVDRLRLILTMQRDHYLPLKVILAHLEEVDNGQTPSLPSASGLSADSLLSSPARYSREEFVRACGATLNLLNDAVSAGLLEPAETFGQESVPVLTAVVELQRSGIEPRHLRTMRQAAEREYSLIERAIVPVTAKHDAASVARAQERSREIAAHLEVVRSQLLRLVISQQFR
jgi:DNA-binding transcriptional MerR regulator